MDPWSVAFSSAFMANVAAQFSGHVLKALAPSVRRRVEKAGGKAAFRDCVYAGVVAACARFRAEVSAEDAKKVAGTFQDFLLGAETGPDAGAELAEVLNGYPPDTEELVRQFAEAEFKKPKAMAGLNLETAFAEFGAAFFQAIVAEPAFQETLRTKKLLEQTEIQQELLGQVEELVELVRAAKAETVQIEAGKVTGTDRETGSDLSVEYRVNITGNVKGGIVSVGKHNRSVVADTYIENYHQSPAEAEKAEAEQRKIALRNRYLEWLMPQLDFLTLEAIDWKAMTGDSDARMRLKAVYTGIMTQETHFDRHMDLFKYEGEEFPVAAKIGNRSAIEVLNDNERIVLLGDPGGGKTTFVRFVALCLAGEFLGRGDANLKLLIEPLPKEEFWRKEDNPPQPWDHGPLLPVFIVLRDLAAEKFPEGKIGAGFIWDFIQSELARHDLGDFFPVLRETLEAGRGIVLLDGLDEVPEAESRREQLKEAISNFIATCGEARVVITSRTYAYHRRDWKIEGLHETTLAPFSDGQIRRFVDRWYAHIADVQGKDADDSQTKAELLKRAIFAADRIRELAERPLLLTLMASLHAWRGGSLPEKRQQLYEKTVELLLETWEANKRKPVGPNGRTEWEPSLTELLQIGREQVRAVLNELAFQAHQSQPENRGTADVPETELVNGLMRHSPKNLDIQPRRLIEYLENRAGILVHRAEEVYTFPHRTFQEYLAACHLTDHPEYPGVMAELVGNDPERWREVTLLAGAKAAEGSAPTIWQLAETLCWREPDDPETTMADAWGAQLAGQALAENADVGRVSGANQRKLDRIRRWLVCLLEGNDFPATERAIAGDSLGVIGDPRFREDFFFLPKDEEGLLGFRYVPAGRFLMGSDKSKDGMAREAEAPQHEVALPAFFISKYPVTVAQFRAFVEDSDYSLKDRNSLKSMDNHPVLNVTWKEAMEYCRWLDDKFRKSELKELETLGEYLTKGFRIRLPTEAEWERAARGTDGRLYPWGDVPDANRANYCDSGIGGTTAVGCFQAGKTPSGCLDMSGNLWEWTLSIWGRDALKEPEFKYPYRHDSEWNNEAASDKIARVGRGGSFIRQGQRLRSAARLRSSPIDQSSFIGLRCCIAPDPPLKAGSSGALAL
jgi:formylglycine-generating enzyme required for sulfatase activity